MHRWKLSALATAAIACVGLTASDAWALALGRVTVQSALGEPLRAEVSIPQISAAEADSLRAAVASPNVFRAQGMEYGGTASNVRVELVRRPDGSAILKLSTAQPVNDPFVDLVIDANWASGSLQRSYTMLLDPPNTRRPAPAVTANAQLSEPERARRPSPVPAVTAAATSSATATPVQRSRPAAAAPASEAPARTTRPEVAAPAGELRIKPGDTAGRLASAYRPGGVSLDQMLVAILRANPQAFISGNVNRLRSGAVISIPDEAAAKSVSVREARQIVAAQARDFNQFRHQLAGNAPTAPVTAANREASGSVQTQVEEAKPAAATPDKLTLTKGSDKNAATDERLAQKKQADDQASREAELKRNMSELGQLAAASKPAGEAASAAGNAAAPAATPGIDVKAAATAAPAPEPAAAPPAESSTASPAAAPATEAAPNPDSAAAAPPSSAEEQPKPAPKPKVVLPPPPPPPEPSFFDSLMEDPAIPLAGIALLAVLLGYGGYKVVQRRRAAAALADASNMGESQLAPDSFFGASGGQQIDTSTNHGSTSQLSAHSMHYSPSQLDAGDGDPLIEAEVYLAYGQDSQAEEILKEALKHQPTRLTLYQKLADIYAKRKDRKAYELNALALRDISEHRGMEWLHVCEAGRTLDPSNPIYQTTADGKPLDSAPTQLEPTLHASNVRAATDAAIGAAAGLAAMGVSSRLGDTGPDSSPSRMDLDFDLSLPGDMLTSGPEITPVAPARPSPAAEPPMPVMPPAAIMPAASIQPELDTSGFSLEIPEADGDSRLQPPAVENTEPITLDTMELNLESLSEAAKPSVAPQQAADPLHNLEFSLSPSPTPATPEPKSDEAAGNLMEFDMSALSLDVPPVANVAAHPATAPSMPEDPLATKLALAKEFSAIGDNEGARVLVEEVLAAAQDGLKAEAQQLLAQLG